MSVQLIAAGFLSVLAAAIHGGAGELLVVRRLSPETLGGTAFGGPRMTRAMIHVTWHVTTIAFLAVGIALGCPDQSSRETQRVLSAWSPPERPLDSPRSPWGWEQPIRERLDPCSVIPAPSPSRSWRRWRGGEPSCCPSDPPLRRLAFG